eukprot:TRINITY_DN4319_c0_g1_i1.p1 TRINITY_DN4319_c0_g1~~TRINITY_DN4319_c0_g1_i1.p1  ORF type:complete len:186 (+),score=127.34 TRINITY_DN4319_c0_g1_i1:77-634(+)
MATVGMKRPAEDILELATPKKSHRPEGAETIDEGKILTVEDLAQEEELENQDEDYVPASDEEVDYSSSEEDSDEEVSALLDEDAEADAEDADESELDELSSSLLDEVSVDGCNLDSEAVDALQTAAKDYLKEVFEAANLIATKVGGRDHITNVDIQVAVEIMTRSRALFKGEQALSHDDEEAEEI